MFRIPARLHRRTLLLSAAAAVAAPSVARAAGNATPLPPMTEGPFYPPPAWRARGPFAGDWDADLTRVTRGGRERVAEGEPLGLELQVRDTRGRALDGAVVEIWQCDTWGRYRHPRDGAQPAEVDEGFQGYGEARAGAQGAVSFRTIRPALYAGRTPHIHVKLRHPSFGEITSQLFVDGDPGNAGDFLWRRLSAAERAALAMKLQPVPAQQRARDGGLRWQSRHVLVVPA
ncbi:MAG: intradiol ring-cleavage dioxygenase [Betaproteobacteria bacterium]